MKTKQIAIRMTKKEAISYLEALADKMQAENVNDVETEDRDKLIAALKTKGITGTIRREKFRAVTKLRKILSEESVDDLIEPAHKAIWNCFDK